MNGTPPTYIAFLSTMRGFSRQSHDISRPTKDAPAARVVIATVNRLTGDTGIHAHTRALYDGLRAAGINCTVSSPFSHGPWWLPIFAVRRAIRPLHRTASTRWYRHWHLVALRNNLLAEFAAIAPSAVVAQCPLSADAALQARRRLGLSFPVLMVCHFNFSEATEYREKGELRDEATFQAVLRREQCVLEAVDQVIYVSAWAKHVVEHDRGIRPRRSGVIWNGISSACEQPAAARAALGLGAEDLALINVGTLEPRKNQLGLINVFTHLAARHPAARLLLVGGGPWRKAVEQSIQRNSLQSRVSLLGHRNDVPALLAAADLYVHYASMENCPVVLLEAARAGIPIAGATGGGMAELLDALQGIALNGGDPVAAAEALDALLTNADLRRRAGRASRAAFEQRFTRDAMVKAYVSAMVLPAADMPRGHK